MTSDSDGDLRALDAWSTFPVDADPRPLVLVGPAVQVRGGYVSGDAKHASFTGRPVPDPGVDVPADVLEAVTPPNAAAPGKAAALRISAATFGEAEFMTDRGPLTLPAWHLRFADMDGPPTAVLDPAVLAAAWDAGSASGGSPMADAVLEADGRTVVFSFVGSPARYTDYPEALLHETETAVMVVPVGVEKPNSGGVRALYAEGRSVRAVLAAPLGARVLVDWLGKAVAVVSAASPQPPAVT